MVGVVGQRRVVDLLYLWLALQVLNDLQRVEHVALHTEAQRLQALQQHPGVERRDASALIAQKKGAHTGNKRGGNVAEDQAVVRLVGLGETGELIVLEVIELASVYNDATQARSVATYKLRGRVHHNVGSVLQRTDEVGRAEGVVDNHGNAVAVGYLGRALNIGDVGVGVAQGFDEHQLGVGLDGGLQGIVIVGGDKRGGDAVFRQGVLQQVIGAAIDGLRGHHVVAGIGQVGDGVGNGCGT